MKNEKQIKIDGYKCIKLDEWKAEKVKYVIGKAEDEEFPLFYAKVQRVNDNDDLIDDDYILSMITNQRDQRLRMISSMNGVKEI